MQSMISAWLGLSIPWIFACLVTFYLGTAALIVWLSFGSPLSGRILSFKGVVAPFFGSTAIIFGLLIAFLSNDIWDRNKQAERIVLTESDTLLALHSLSAASGADDKTLRTAIRAYAQAVVDDEWPKLALEQRSPPTDAALNALLREVALPGASKDVGIQRTMLDMVLRIRAAHEDRLVLSADRTVPTKWAAVCIPRSDHPGRDRPGAPGQATTASGRAVRLHAGRGVGARIAGRTRIAVRASGVRAARADPRRAAASAEMTRPQPDETLRRRFSPSTATLLRVTTNR